LDFLKYISSVVTAKKSEPDQYQDMIDRRSALLKHVFSFPFLLSLPFVRWFFAASSRDSNRKQR